MCILPCCVLQTQIRSQKESSSYFLLVVSSLDDMWEGPWFDVLHGPPHPGRRQITGGTIKDKAQVQKRYSDTLHFYSVKIALGPKAGEFFTIPDKIIWCDLQSFTNCIRSELPTKPFLGFDFTSSCKSVCLPKVLLTSWDYSLNVSEFLFLSLPVQGKPVMVSWGGSLNIPLLGCFVLTSSCLYLKNCINWVNMLYKKERPTVTDLSSTLKVRER